ncbi:MAG: hypothetical protein UZ02_AOB001000143 [Nitrosomonas europaea]|nr:MAG: hypothetical protein UZ02_AOB001000143 [Nitrosomonas europaea]
MLTKITAKNQLTLPKSVTAAIGAPGGISTRCGNLCCCRSGGQSHMLAVSLQASTHCRNIHRIRLDSLHSPQPTRLTWDSTRSNQLSIPCEQN